MTRGSMLTTLGLAGALVSVTGCGPDRGPQSWIGENSAAIRCTSAGPTRMPPALLGVPAPPAPTGLYARGLDPLALDELGFERDHVACAVLQAPSEEELETTRAGVSEFVAARTSASSAAIAVAGPCTCDVARSIGLDELVNGCTGAPAKRRCNPERTEAAMQGVLNPLVEQLAALPLPLRHWRLVGPSDREGWFGDNYADLLDRHPGGSTVFLVGEAITERENGPLIQQLFQVDGVTAIVRQDSGRALLIIRESRGDLILDHFSYPAPIPIGIVHLLDNNNYDEYARRLAKPGSTRSPLLDVTKGNIVEFDWQLVDAVDQMAEVAGLLMDTPYDPEQETLVDPEPYVDRVAYQAPFGREGEALMVKAQLTELGTKWAQGTVGAVLSPTMIELGLTPQEPPSFTPPSPDTSKQISYVGRGTQVQFAGVHGLRMAPEVFAAIERTHPGTIQGKGDEWAMEIPKADLTGAVGPGGPFSGLREMFTRKPYKVTLSFPPERDVVDLRAAPR